LHTPQVPTRQEGPVTVERRPSYRGRSVFHSKVHLDELGVWLVYEEDYDLAMAPVLESQRRDLALDAQDVAAATQDAEGSREGDGWW
jgi:hypothetical protein